jgi:hypothetical protein
MVLFVGVSGKRNTGSLSPPSTLTRPFCSFLLPLPFTPLYCAPRRRKGVLKKIERSFAFVYGVNKWTKERGEGERRIH